MPTIDLHTHTSASDGTYTPSELIDYAVKKGLSAIAITDHDNTDGIDEAIERSLYYAQQGIDIEVIPGIEFSTGYMGSDVHIVGLYIDHKGEYLKGRLSHFVKNREKRNVEMCQRLTDANMPVNADELHSTFPDSVITRAHFAKYLHLKGFVSSVREAFDRYIGDGKPYFVSRKKISPMRAVEIIRKAGGFPVLAHPVLYGFSKAKLDTLVSKLKHAGLMGIEAVYSTYTPSDERDIRALAQKYDIAISGGSDFHGGNKPDIDLATGRGHLYIPDDILKDIKLRHQKMLQTNTQYKLPKILFTDLDGTLLPESKRISDYTYEVLKKWTEYGHYLVLCSGRDISSVNAVYHENRLDTLDNVYTIGFNGGLIYDPQKEKTLFRKGLNLEDARYIAQKAREAGIYMQAYGDDFFVAPYDGKERAYYSKVIKTNYIISEDVIEPLKNEPCKCLMIELDDTSKTDRFIKDITPWAKEHNISLLYSNDNYVEIIPSSSGKGVSAEYLVKLLDIPGLISIGAGDEQNDVSLLNACDIAIAMSNGKPCVKDAATTISEDDCEHDGLAKTLLGLI